MNLGKILKSVAKVAVPVVKATAIGYATQKLGKVAAKSGVGAVAADALAAALSKQRGA